MTPEQVRVRPSRAKRMMDDRDGAVTKLLLLFMPGQALAGTPRDQ